MTKKAKHLFLIIVILLLVACDGTSKTTPTLAVTESVSVSECTFDIEIHEVPDPSPGDKVYLFPNLDNSFGLTFQWQADPPILLGDDPFSPFLIVPNDAHQISVELVAINDEGCRGEDSLVINVAVPVVAEAETSTAVESEPTSTATTAEVALEATAVSTNTPAPTPEPTMTPTTMPTPTVQPVTTVTPEVTAVPRPQYSAPVITQLEFLPGGAVVVAWAWDGELTPTQNFAVRFWSEADDRPEARYSITWTKDFHYQFNVDNTDFPKGTYLLNVAVMEGPSDGVHYAIVESENKSVFVEAIPPTAPVPVGP